MRSGQRMSRRAACCLETVCLLSLAGCPAVTPPDGNDTPLDPATAERAIIDRFSPETGTLYVRDDENGFPGPNEPVDFDQPPFITRGLGPEGAIRPILQLRRPTGSGTTDLRALP
jgi:hypothetical protein